jgi:hypothetical protein
MALQTRDACGFNNGQAKLTYSFDDAVTPLPLVTQIQLINDGPTSTFNVELLDRTTRAVAQSFSRVAGTGVFTLPRTAPGQQPSIQRIFGGDLFMVDVTGHDGSHGWDFPYFYRCWSS